MSELQESEAVYSEVAARPETKGEKLELQDNTCYGSVNVKVPSGKTAETKSGKVVTLLVVLIVLVVLLVLAVAVGTIAFALEISKLKSETALIKQQNSSAEQQSNSFSHQEEHSHIESALINETQQLFSAISANFTDITTSLSAIAANLSQLSLKSVQVEMGLSMLEQVNNNTQETVRTALVEFTSNFTEIQSANQLRDLFIESITHLPSCAALPPSSLSGYYMIRASNGSAVRVYCDMTRSCGNVTGGWMRVAELDMTNSSHQCPPWSQAAH